MSYPVPTEQAFAEIEIKKSRFLGYAKGISNREEGMAWLEVIKQKYPDARHHCWAYLLGNPSCATNAGMGDDGEPSGTAGKPILNVLQHRGVGDIMIIVVRYFGGIKLGAGGLTRAYGQSAQAVMEILNTELQVPVVSIKLVCDFSQEQQIRYFLNQSQGNIVQVDYQNRVIINALIPEAGLTPFQQNISSMGCEFRLLD